MNSAFPPPLYNISRELIKDYFIPSQLLNKWTLHPIQSRHQQRGPQWWKWAVCQRWLKRQILTTSTCIFPTSRQLNVRLNITPDRLVRLALQEYKLPEVAASLPEHTSLCPKHQQRRRKRKYILASIVPEEEDLPEALRLCSTDGDSCGRDRKATGQAGEASI